MPPSEEQSQSSQSSQSIESRFAHLLKPIRDLAENWDVDVASELEGGCERECVFCARTGQREGGVGGVGGRIRVATTAGNEACLCKKV